MLEPYLPQRGDLVWLSFDPQAGHEQAGRRPALVISPGAYQAKTGLALVAPITSRGKGYPFEVPLPQGLPVHGVVLADHLRSVDWRARQAEFITTAPPEVVEEVLGKVGAVLRS